MRTILGENMTKELMESTTEENPVASTELSEADEYHATESDDSVDLSKFGGDFDKLGKSYGEAERRLRQVQQEKAELAKEVSRAQTLEQQYTLAMMELNKRNAPQEPDEFQLYKQEWEQDPARAAFEQSKRERRSWEYGQQSEKTAQAYHYAKANYPGFEQLEPTMTQIALQARKEGYISPDKLNRPEVINLLYYTAKGMYAQQESQQQAHEKEKEKRKRAAVAEGSSVGGSSEPVTFKSAREELEFMKKKIGVSKRPDYLSE